jgi:exodeoxyribonuclease-5
MHAWLSARFGRDRSTEGLGRLPPLPALGEEDFFAELFAADPDRVITHILETANFLRKARTARAVNAPLAPALLHELSSTIGLFADWYANCGIEEGDTAEIVADLNAFKAQIDSAASGPITGRGIAQLLLHAPPSCTNKKEPRFNQFKKKGKWEAAATAGGQSKARGGQLNAAATSHYDTCSSGYTAFVAGVAAAAFAQFVGEFSPLATLYADYKQRAALLDFDDLLHHARDLLAGNAHVRAALAKRYSRILVDEFQDTDPLQAEILWRLCGEIAEEKPWMESQLRPGSLFVVGDPKQAIYRFRGADVDTYLQAKAALLARDKDAVLEIVANFRSLKPIIDFANAQFQLLLSTEQGQPGFTELRDTRTPTDDRPAVARFNVPVGDEQKNANGELIVDKVRRVEAEVVADLVKRMIGSYLVWDKRSKSLRPCRAGDIALLAPTGTSLWIYERALEQQQISISSQAGKSFYSRQEVQDLIAVARAIADRRDTLALGALLRGPVVGLSEEEIADAIMALPAGDNGSPGHLHLWTDLQQIANPVLKRVLEVLQQLARRARQTTPYRLMAEAIEELNIRPILRARYRLSSERALANVEMILEMARAYDARGLVAYAAALKASWEDTKKHIEGRPDADAEAVSISTMHSAKGLEWPIVIPINSPTKLDESVDFLHRRSDNTVHFKLLGFTGPEYETVKTEEQGQVRRERIRLWYVALTRACDLLLLPHQSERSDGDWFSLLNIDTASLPLFDADAFEGVAIAAGADAANAQDPARWKNEAGVIASTKRAITWRSPSRHDGIGGASLSDEDAFIGDEARDKIVPEELAFDEVASVKGSRERGLILHKLLEEVITGETPDDAPSLEARGRALLGELGIAEAARAEEGIHAPELAASVRRALALPEIVSLRPQLLAEVTVLSAAKTEKGTSFVGGIADALTLNGEGRVDFVIDWKSDVDPSGSAVDLYRQQVRDYLVATGGQEGLLVFVTSGRVERVNL